MPRRRCTVSSPTPAHRRTAGGRDERHRRVDRFRAGRGSDRRPRRRDSGSSDMMPAIKAVVFDWAGTIDRLRQPRSRSRAVSTIRFAEGSADHRGRGTRVTWARPSATIIRAILAHPPCRGGLARSTWRYAVRGTLDVDAAPRRPRRRSCATLRAMVPTLDPRRGGHGRSPARRRRRDRLVYRLHPRR